MWWIRKAFLYICYNDATYKNILHNKCNQAQMVSISPSMSCKWTSNDAILKYPSWREWVLTRYCVIQCGKNINKVLDFFFKFQLLKHPKKNFRDSNWVYQLNEIKNIYFYKFISVNLLYHLTLKLKFENGCM